MPSAPPSVLVTPRLVLRRWREEDVEPFAAMNADPEVMRWFPAPLTHAETVAMVDRLEAGFAERGHGLWALERRDSGEFIGFTGLAPMPEGSPGQGGTEVGWRLARAAWGHGFATEAARASLDDGFGRVGLDEVWSWTAVGNTASQAVMRRLGLREHSRSLHPRLPVDHPLAEHVTYHRDRSRWPMPLP